MRRYVSIPASVVRAAMDAAGWRCRYCGIALTSKNHTIDHFIPLAAGGGDEASNLVPACRACNFEKRNRIFATVEAAATAIRARLGEPPPTEAAPFAVLPRRSGSTSREADTRSMQRWRAKNRQRYRDYMRRYMADRRRQSKLAQHSAAEP